ncbi:MAG: glycosyltransferase [Cyanobacteria bacterium]|jgi:glycosyltransferase involved in cell wall biosynthesis|nr:glycosyltransferase [Cyanobacteria bacterium GSL.Bin1]
MKKPSLTIFYQFDPWHSSIGGIQMVVRNFIKFAPPELTLRLVGVEATSNGAVGQWQSRELAGRPVEFFPLFRILDDDRRQLIPTSLRYALSLWGKDFTSDFMHFHRLESALFAKGGGGHRTLFVHNDIHQQMRSSDTKGILWRRFPQVYFAFERQLMPRFDRILSCNSESTQLYQKQYPKLAQRISFVRNSFDGEVFYHLSVTERDQKRQQQAIRMGLAEDTRFLLFAGRLHPQKDPLLLLEAFSLLSDPRAHLLVAGKGELAATMVEKAEELGIAKRVTFLGTVHHQKLANFHRLASLLVLTSAYEGLPLVVLEALACGTPVVTTQTGETPRLLRQECGIICRDRAPDKIAKAIDTVLQFPERFPSEACIQNAIPYSAKRVIEEVYADMLQHWQFLPTHPRQAATH